jgi:hypothetical protein
VYEALYHINVNEYFPLAKEEENMATIELTENTFIARVEGVDKIFAFKSQLEVPLSHVAGAEVDPLVVQEWGNLWKGVRIPGAHVPGLLAAGNFYQHGERVFWDVHDPQKAVTIHLADEQYAKLVIEVEDPARTIAAIEEAVHRRQTD